MNAASLVRAYARSLLPASWLFVLCSKLAALIDKAAPGLPAADSNTLRHGLIQLRSHAASTAEPYDHEDYMLAALTIAGRAIRPFSMQAASLPLAAASTHRLLTPASLDRWRTPIWTPTGWSNWHMR